MPCVAAPRSEPTAAAVLLLRCHHRLRRRQRRVRTGCIHGHDCAVDFASPREVVQGSPQQASRSARQHGPRDRSAHERPDTASGESVDQGSRRIDAHTGSRAGNRIGARASRAGNGHDGSGDRASGLRRSLEEQRAGHERSAARPVAWGRARARHAGRQQLVPDHRPAGCPERDSDDVRTASSSRSGSPSSVMPCGSIRTRSTTACTAAGCSPWTALTATPVSIPISATGTCSSPHPTPVTRPGTGPGRTSSPRTS